MERRLNQAHKRSAADPEAPSTAARPSRGPITVGTVFRNQWLTTVIVCALAVILSLIVGFATRGAGKPSTQTTSSSATPASAAASSAASTTTVTASSLRSAVQASQLTWNGTAVGFADPQVTLSNGVVTSSATYIYPDTSMEQALAVATAAFADSNITSVHFNSLGDSGSAMVRITIDASLTPVSALTSLQSGTPEDAYRHVSSYAISEDARSAAGYTIPATGGTNPTASATSATSTASASN